MLALGHRSHDSMKIRRSQMRKELGAILRLAILVMMCHPESVRAEDRNSTVKAYGFIDNNIPTLMLLVSDPDGILKLVVYPEPGRVGIDVENEKIAHKGGPKPCPKAIKHIEVPFPISKGFPVTVDVTDCQKSPTVDRHVGLKEDGTQRKDGSASNPMVLTQPPGKFKVEKKLYNPNPQIPQKPEESEKQQIKPGSQPSQEQQQ